MDVALLAEGSIHLQPLSEALYNAVVNFLRNEFENRLEDAVKFLTEFEVDEKHALAVFKVIKLLLVGIGKTCGNCQKYPCLNGQGITQENFTPGARVNFIGDGVSPVCKLVRDDGDSLFTGENITGQAESGYTLDPTYYAYNC